MPTLVPSKWTTVHPIIPYAWSCSECQAAFDLGTLCRQSEAQKQIDHINSQFEFHCKEVHPRSFPVTGLKVANP